MKANINVREVLLKRGNVAVASAYTGPIGELTVDTTLHSVRVHDGVTPGGWLQASTGVTDYLLANAASQASDITILYANAGIQSGNISILYANAGVQATEISNLWANASAQQTTINSINSNVGALLGNLTIVDQTIGGTVANADIILSPDGTGFVSVPNLKLPVGSLVQQEASIEVIVADLILDQLVDYSTGEGDNLGIGDYGLPIGVSGSPPGWAVYQFTTNPTPVLEIEDIISGVNIPVGSTVLYVGTGANANIIVTGTTIPFIDPPVLPIPNQDVFIVRPIVNASLTLSTLGNTDISLSAGEGGRIITHNTIAPYLSDVIDLGTPTKRFKRLWLGAGSIYVQDETLGIDLKLTAIDGNFVIAGGAGLDVGQFIFHDNQLLIKDSTRDIIVGATGATGFVKFNRPIAVASATTGLQAFTVGRTGLTKIFTPATLLTTESALSVVGTLSGNVQPRNFTGTLLHLTAQDNSPARLSIDAFGAGTYASIASRAARGTVDAPAQTLGNDTMLRITSQGWTSAGAYAGSILRINMEAAENFTPTNLGTRIAIQTTPIGSNVIQTSFTIDAGNISLVNNANLKFSDGTVQRTAANATAINANITTIQGNITTLFANAASQASDITILYANAATQDTSITNLWANAASQDSSIINLWANAAIQDGNIVSLWGNAASQEDEITGLRANIIAANVTISTIISSSYGNANVAEYLPYNSTIIGINANVAGANAAIVTANTAMKAYSDYQDGLITTAWTANAASQAGDITILYANAASQSANITTLFANAATQDSSIISLWANAGIQEDEITSLRANITAANIAISNIVSSSYGNANVATYLPTDTTIIGINANVAGANAAIISANTAMKAYSDYQDGLITTAWTANAASQAGDITILYANAASQSTSITTLFSNAATQDSSIISLWANAASQEDEITSLRANITAANAAIITANTAMKGYVDAQIVTLNSNIVTANSAVVSYVNTLNSAMASNVAGANAAIISANTAMKAYSDYQDGLITTAWTANAAFQEDEITSLRANVTAANAAISTLQTTGVKSVTASDGITGNVTSGNIGLTNSDKGSSQFIFKNIAVGGQTTVTATTNNDTVNLVAGSGITITTLSKNVSFVNSGVTSLAGGNNIIVSASTGAVTITRTDGLQAVITGNASATITLTAADQYVGSTRSLTGACTVTLPAGSSVPAGRQYTIKDEGGQSGNGSRRITIAAAGSDTIDGSATRTITSNYGALTVLWTGTRWSVT